ncbi:MAG: hypothetical protein PUP91_26140 [Rhizonema sp. PD37]|nr:hypothetical protein [Rhizonema sp. PD37]
MTLFPAFGDWWNDPVGASPDHLVRSGIVFSLGETQLCVPGVRTVLHINILQAVRE